MLKTYSKLTPPHCKKLKDVFDELDVCCVLEMSYDKNMVNDLTTYFSVALFTSDIRFWGNIIHLYKMSESNISGRYHKY